MNRLKTGSPTAKPHETIPCAFCQGRGVDPFHALSDRSTCGSCQGRGTVVVPMPHVRCVYCSGTGSHKTYRCLICGGSGVVAALVGPTRTCPDCEGKAFESSSGLACLTCKGRGVVMTRPKRTQRPRKAQQ
jgi:DnaJ-class molecular chaperone